MLNWQHTEVPKPLVDTLPRPERRENRLATIGQEHLSDDLDLRWTLKLLVTSRILRRNTLLSSKASTLWPRSCVPV